jgi:hypothetical protein
LATESVKRDGLTKEMSDMLDSMSFGRVKTKSIISESLKPASEQKTETSNLLDESNLMEEI